MSSLKTLDVFSPPSSGFSLSALVQDVGYWVAMGLALTVQMAQADVTYEQVSITKTKPGYTDAYTYRATASCSTGRILIGVSSSGLLTDKTSDSFNFTTQNGAVCTDHSDSYTRMRPIKDSSGNLIGFEAWYAGHYNNTATCNITGTFVCAKVCN